MRNKIMAGFDAIIFLIAIYSTIANLYMQQWNVALLSIIIILYAHDSYKLNRGIKS